MKPIIGINCDLTEGETSGASLRREYYEAIKRAGGMPVLFAPLEEVKDIERLLGQLSGLILSGGRDIWPVRYGEIMHEKTHPVSAERDAFDFKVVKQALNMDMPVLGICYGAQLLNVALGGSLIQDLPSQRPSPICHNSETGHKINVEPGTCLHKFLQTEELTVNSTHHQAIDRLAEGLRVSARAEDGVIEAIESIRHSLVIAVQWHPERMSSDSAQEQLFKAFVEMTRTHRR